MTTIPRRALGLARELTLTVHHKTESFLDPAPRRFAANLRRAALALSLGLEGGGEPAERCRSALACLWRLSDLVDHAERLGYLDLDEAMELLHLGSRVEILLVPAAGLAGDRESDDIHEASTLSPAPPQPQPPGRPTADR